MDDDLLRVLPAGIDQVQVCRVMDVRRRDRRVQDHHALVVLVILLRAQADFRQAFIHIFRRVFLMRVHPLIQDLNDLSDCLRSEPLAEVDHHGSFKQRLRAKFFQSHKVLRVGVLAQKDYGPFIRQVFLFLDKLRTECNA